MDATIFSDSHVEGAIDLDDLRIRRCCGCVKCLTEEQGRCHIDDGFSGRFDDILGHRTLVFDVHPRGGRLPTIILKAVERVSNVLEAYTDSGGNVPLSCDSVALRDVEFHVHGDMDREDFEREMRADLEKGPVKAVSFFYD